MKPKQNTPSYKQIISADLILNIFHPCKLDSNKGGTLFQFTINNIYHYHSSELKFLNNTNILYIVKKKENRIGTKSVFFLYLHLMHYDMKVDLNSIDCAENEAVFIVGKNGDIMICNNIASKMFGFDSPEELIGVNASCLVPDDFSQFFPDTITYDHLTKNDYLPRVNKRTDGSLFPTLILTYFQIFDKSEYIIVHVFESDSCTDIQTLCLKQNIELLKCELEKEKRMKQQATFSITALTKDYPNLTQTDLKFCELIVNKKTAEQISDILNIKVESVFTARKRLRRKLELKSNDILFSHLINYIRQEKIDRN